MSPEDSNASTGSPLKTGILIAVIVAALGGAGYMTWSGGRSTDQPDTPASAAPYMCQDCGSPFELTPAALVQLGKEGGIESSRGGRMAIRCPKCGKLAGRPALKCPNDGTIFPMQGENGQPTKCPQCGWAP